MIGEKIKNKKRIKLNPRIFGKRIKYFKISRIKIGKGTKRAFNG
ncbi:MAG: hypothetical protein E6Z21_07490 [Anaerococcus vaginalis]|jgi:hypothetical protein|nr:hypothetical protein HMPREF3224_01675 [Anaerococcus hydrogenalis]MDU2829944.1 hypothetical protein [Anaerococcus sp.]MDU5914112.1 hypothetical protein [Anaerococcus vaginalis]